MKASLFTLCIIFLSFQICFAQEASWFLGVWKGGALERKKATTQNLQTTFTIETVNKDSFSGVLKVMLLSDTSVHFDSKVTGNIHRNYLTAILGESIYKKDPSGGKWETRCRNCGPINFIYSLQNNRFVLTGEITNCLKTCNGTSVYSREMDDFTPVAKKSLAELVTSNAVAMREAAINDSLQLIAKAMKTLDSIAALSRLTPPTEESTAKSMGVSNGKNRKRDKQNTNTNTVIDSSSASKSVDTNPTSSSLSDSAVTVVPSTKNVKETASAKAQNQSAKAQQPIAQPPQKKEEVFEKRPTTIVTAYNISTDSITLHVFDNGIVDGDTVSVFYNDAIVINRLGLTTRAFVIKLPVNPTGDNKIVLYAHNLGEIPPNSAMIEIYSGKKMYSVTVTSDLQTSSSVVLRYKKE